MKHPFDEILPAGALAAATSRRGLARILGAIAGLAVFGRAADGLAAPGTVNAGAGRLTTRALGEEGGVQKTMAMIPSEMGGRPSPVKPMPVKPMPKPQITTQAFGEEGGTRR